MSVTKLLARIQGLLEEVDVPYMLTGSFASAAHGVPRATQDIDFVIAPNRVQLLLLLQALPEDQFYASEEAATDALKRRGQFNVIDYETGWKIDFIFRKNRAFSRQELERRVALEVAGVKLHVASPEDTVIAKLEWASLGGSARQLEDVSGILEMQGASLDLEYVEKWVGMLDLDAQWAAVSSRER